MGKLLSKTMTYSYLKGNNLLLFPLLFSYYNMIRLNKLFFVKILIKTIKLFSLNSQNYEKLKKKHFLILNNAQNINKKFRFLLNLEIR